MALNNFSSWTVSVLRLGRGLGVRQVTTQPEKRLVLYEFEACPYCRKVREVLSELDLDYHCIPCARGSKHRAEVAARGGAAMFPYLVDPNTEVAMYQSEDIITYLCETYGKGRSVLGKLSAPLNISTAALSSMVRPKGRVVSDFAAQRPDPEQPLLLWGFEASPYCRKARERLNELDLPYVCHNVAKRGSRRQALV
ncbi:MAG: glutathione S-transferase N-terminal domain-containing protein, partial [Myxococcales bacterium]|nr:glutathione S-transferase N-terminal domain-containing protein [Myxococcales bacterium]